MRHEQPHHDILTRLYGEGRHAIAIATLNGILARDVPSTKVLIVYLITQLFVECVGESYCSYCPERERVRASVSPMPGSI